MMNSCVFRNDTLFRNKVYPIVGLMCLAFLFLLSGCSTVSHQDGPPNFYVDETRVPDAVPRPEPISKYGNYHRYVVWGKVYHTLPTSKGYEEQGIASWYGTKFHKHHTSSGERYDMLAMTAAHKTLPLPTYVQVTNLKNGKKVIVKVNDRGPFSGNRLIDLSYVAAKKLGMIGHGTTRVDVKAIDPIEYARNGEKYLPIGHPSRHHAVLHYAKTRSAHHLYLQVGAFQSLSNAERLQSRVSQLTSSPVQIAKLAHKHHHLYHVRIGPLKDMATANQLTRKLRTIGLSGKLA